MKLTRFLTMLLAILIGPSSVDLAAADTFGSGANSFDIDFVAIGNPGNAADTEDGDSDQSGIQIFGSVAQAYRIGKFEVSEQMIDKANAEGGLGITKDTRGPNKPATSVSWLEATKFVNWLNTNSGGTEAYKFDGGGNFHLWAPGDAGYNPNNLYRNSRARYFLPSADEWYKAAYFDPTGGVYFDYPTGSDGLPDGIDFAGDSNFDAVFFDGGANPQPNDFTDVGMLSRYGTAGQGGNVWEWEETEFDLVNDSTSSVRGIRGGFWLFDSGGLLSSERSVGIGGPSGGGTGIGFRVASIPEPSALVLLGMEFLGSFGLLVRKRAR